VILSRASSRFRLADVLARIAGHAAKRVAELLPWNSQPANSIPAAEPEIRLPVLPRAVTSPRHSPPEAS
jgi:hypothetical protein